MRSRSDSVISTLFASLSRSRVWIVLIVGAAMLLIGSFMGDHPTEQTLGEEERVEQMCSMIEGVGECRVMMTYYPDDDDRVYAVLVLCEGAGAVEVRERIVSAICSLYGIGSHRVEIERLNK